MTLITNIKIPRVFTPYERTQLRRAGIDPDSFSADDTRPVEYLTGQADFCGWTVHVSPDVLIPRVETEQLVELVTAEITTRSLHQQTQPHIADVGTGSGAIGLSVWRWCQQAGIELAVTLSDVSPAALTIAEKNLTTLLGQTNVSPANRPTLLHSDLLQAYQPHSIDVLVANLPYIPTATVSVLDASVIDHEPRLALDGGADGLDLIGALLQQAPAYLKSHGTVFLEVDDSHDSEKITALLTRAGLLEVLAAPTFFPDCFGKQRFVRLELRS